MNKPVTLSDYIMSLQILTTSKNTFDVLKKVGEGVRFSALNISLFSVFLTFSIPSHIFYDLLKLVGHMNTKASIKMK